MANMNTKTVGVFEFKEGAIYGPAEYMRDRGNAHLRNLLDGKVVSFNMTMHLSPDVTTAILVALQTDYAGWKGTRQLLEVLR